MISIGFLVVRVGGGVVVECMWELTHVSRKIPASVDKT